MSDFQFYVINLASSATRWRSIEDSAKDLDVKINRIDAVDGRLKKPSEWHDIDEHAFKRFTGREILPGEYGCYRSHIIAIEAFLRSDDSFAVILEDDVVPVAQTAERISTIIQELPDLDVVKLVNHRVSGFMLAKQTLAGDKIGRSVFGPQGSAAAYLLSRRGAEKILSSHKTMRLPWDVALEQYWAYEGNFFSLKENLLKFTEERHNSNIAPDGYSSTQSALAYVSRALPRFNYHFLQFQRGARGPDQERSIARLHPLDLGYPFFTYILAGLMFLILGSPVWFETDAYRFALLLLAVPATYHYFSKDLWRYDKPLFGWIGLICSIWAVYVLTRFLYDYVANGGTNLGSAEGVYIFPIFYATLGYVMWRLCKKPFWIIVAFMFVSILVLAIYTDYQSIFSEERATYANHNNPIHASGAAGFILIIAFYFASYIVSIAKMNLFQRAVLLSVAMTTLALALINILNLHSKGVWVALIVTSPVILLLFGRNYMHNRLGVSQVLLLGSIILIAIVAIILNSQELVSIGGATFATVTGLLVEVANGNGLTNSIIGMIGAEGVPFSQTERLKLWADALIIWSQAPIFGVGIEWRTLWNDREFSHLLQYNIFHNGFLEIAVRYGYVGLCFYGLALFWACRKVLTASRHGLIHPLAASCYVATLVYFLATNLSNSNLRLALGESYMLLAMGFGFYCAFRLQEIPISRPKTLF